MKVFSTLFTCLLLISQGFAQQTNPPDLKLNVVQGADLQPINSKLLNAPVQETPTITAPEVLRTGPGIGHLAPAAIPANDDCANAIAIAVNAACINGTNKESTVQAGENTGCQGAITKSVWYKFTATAASMYVEVERTASSGCYLSSAVYSGGCLPSTVLACEDAAFGPNLNIHNLTGLTVGATYLIQVGYTAGGPCGNNNNVNTGADFCIKVGRPVSCGTCAAPCGPMCVFATNPTVAQVTSTCTQYNLQSRLNAGQVRTQCYTFTAVAASFSLQMIINTVGCSSGNVTTFDWNLYPSNCSGVVQSGNLSNLNATGLTIGASYVLCYTWTAACQHNSVYPYMVATSPLPVELVLFDGDVKGENIVLKWITASEKNNNYFSVQRSANGADFTEIGRIKGAGTTTNMQNYTFSDKDPIHGTNYYRIVQYDFDNSAASSGIVALKFLDSYNVVVDKNPVTDLLTLAFDSEHKMPVTVKIVNHFGSPVITEQATIGEGFDELHFQVASLSKGVYFVNIESNGISRRVKFIKM